MKSTGFAAYKVYLAVKSHFTHDSYDYFKYGGKTRASAQTFERRQDRYFFEKLAKRYSESELLEFFISNFLMNDQLWIGDAFDSHCDHVYSNWKKTQESITYIFGQDCEFMLNHIEKSGIAFNALFSPTVVHEVGAVEHTKYPLAFQMCMSGEIHIETLVLLDCILGFVQKAHKKLKGDFTWDTFYKKIRRYKPFVSVCANPDRFKKLLKEKISKHDVKA
jgi:hypothetical protein